MKPQPIKPGPGQESVWDYPRPPRLEQTSKRLQVIFNGVTLADTTHGYRVLETSHAPTYYISPNDVAMEYLRLTHRATACEWKSGARYYTVEVNGRVAVDAAWSYPNPVLSFVRIKDYIAFYPAPMDACYVDGVKAQPQQGGYYGGWVTPDIVGPIKGVPGSWGW